MPGVLQIDDAETRIGMAVAAGARRVHAVEHVDAALDAAEDVVGLAHPHQVARLVGGQLWGDLGQYPEHGLLRLAHRETTDRVAIKADGLQPSRRSGTQFRIVATLHDAEQRAVRLVAEGILAPLRPAQRQLHRPLHFLALGRQRDALIELHDDVAVEQRLDLDRALRRQLIGRPVDMRAEGDALLGELAQLGQRHHLEAAAVGQDRPLPVHEIMQPAQRRHLLGARPQHQMIGVAEEDIRPGLAHLLGIHGFHRAHGAHRHEGRRLDDRPRGVDAAAAGHAHRCG